MCWPGSVSYTHLAVRGDATGASGWTEAEFDLGGGAVVRTAVVSGLANTGRLLAELQAGRVHYDFVEVMACPGGCAGGGGQPIHTDDVERAAQRGKVLYNIDRIQTVRFLSLIHISPGWSTWPWA